jgi:hypothetical protein
VTKLLTTAAPLARASLFAWAASFAFLGATGAAMAGADGYACKVAHIYSLTVDGSLVAPLDKGIVGSKFTVSRKSGEIAGQILTTGLAMSTRVIEKGSTKNSFRAIAEFGDSFRFGDGSHAYQILDVQEFRSDAVKPFVITSMGGYGIVTGTCE